MQHDLDVIYLNPVWSFTGEYIIRPQLGETRAPSGLLSPTVAYSQDKTKQIQSELPLCILSASGIQQLRDIVGQSIQSMEYNSHHLSLLHEFISWLFEPMPSFGDYNL